MYDALCDGVGLLHSCQCVSASYTARLVAMCTGISVRQVNSALSPNAACCYVCAVRQLKLVRGTKSTTAFVEFADIASAMMVHQGLQGAVLSSSDRGGIRIQYSKNPFGKRDVGESPSPVAARLDITG